MLTNGKRDQSSVQGFGGFRYGGYRSVLRRTDTEREMAGAERRARGESARAREREGGREGARGKEGGR